MKNVILKIMVLTGLLLISTGFIINKADNNLRQVKKEYKELFIKKDIPKENISIEDINKVKGSLNKVYGYEDEKKKLEKSLKELDDYIKVRDEINKHYNENIMLSKTTQENIDKLYLKNSTLSKKYQKQTNGKIQNLQYQRNNINNIEEKINALYEDENNTQLKQDITKELVETYRQELLSIPQKDIVEKNIILLDNANKIIAEREEAERKRQEEIRRQQEEERRRREEEIKNAWVILNVPYISQNRNNVLNGCEAAALLMGLQYKGYLKNMSLYQYATDMPKSTNPYEGFTHDIFGKDPVDIPHWIAPSPLAKFGRDSSGNQNIVNGTGMSLEELDRELDNGNPVVIYLTAMFKPPKLWIEGAPQNIHVQLLTGYNKITKEHIITDPWTYDSGRTKWTVSKNQLETIYNALGKQNVIIK